MTLSSQNKMAYGGLVEADAEVQAVDSIRLDEWADAAGVDAMHSLILDFDAKGRLIGIEVFNAKKVLPPSLIDKARRISQREGPRRRADQAPSCVCKRLPTRHPGVMALTVQHEQVREAEDRSWTLVLLDELRSPSTSEKERDEAVCTLAALMDYRSVGPLTAMVEDDQLRESVRKAAAQVLLEFEDSTTVERRRSWWESGDPVKMAHALSLMERTEADVVISVAGDDGHPLQKWALARMTFGFDEAEFQPVKIRALAHPDADVREMAAGVLLWDEPVAAEGPLLSATSDPSADVAVAAADTLQYYPSRRVLRALAELADAGDDPVRATAAESFDCIRSRFEDLATVGDPEQVALLREWMQPVADLVEWPDEVREREVFSPPAGRSRVVMSAHELLALLLEPDGEWAPKRRALREVAWEAYSTGERGRLCEALTKHPDPVVREAATEPLALWSKSEELLGLASDPSFSVRKSAMYRLGLVPSDPRLAVFAWEYMLGAADMTAFEALQTYAAHVCWRGRAAPRGSGSDRPPRGHPDDGDLMPRRSRCRTRVREPGHASSGAARRHMGGAHRGPRRTPHARTPRARDG